MTNDSQGEKVGAAICCADGRAQGADRKWLKQHRGVQHVDKITCPGVVKRLADCNGHTNSLMLWVMAITVLGLLWYGAVSYSDSFLVGTGMGGVSIWVLTRLFAHNRRVREIKKELGILVRSHGIKHVVISAHHNCAGNPVSKDEQLEQLQRARRTVEAFGYDIEIILLWINDQWMPEEIRPASLTTSRRKGIRGMLLMGKA